MRTLESVADFINERMEVIGGGRGSMSEDIYPRGERLSHSQGRRRRFSQGDRLRDISQRSSSQRREIRRIQMREPRRERKEAEESDS